MHPSSDSCAVPFRGALSLEPPAKGRPARRCSKPIHSGAKLCTYSALAAQSCIPQQTSWESTALNSVADLRAKPTKPASLFGHKVATYGWWCIDVADGRNHNKPQQANMADSGRVSRAFSLSRLGTMPLRKLFEAVKQDRAAGDRTTRQIRAMYERQEAELVCSLDHTGRVLGLLRDESMTAGDERNLVN